ncbi:hypothetical protein D3C76_890400 [compost metagenome]
MQSTWKILRQRDQDTRLYPIAAPWKIYLLRANKNKSCVVVIVICNFPIYNLQPMSGSAKSSTNCSPALARIVLNDFNSFRSTSDRLQFSPRCMLPNKLHALRHRNRMRKDFFHFGEILIPVSIFEFQRVTDEILYRWEDPFRLHREINFINEPINMKTNRSFNRILNRDNAVISGATSRREKDIGN